MGCNPIIKDITSNLDVCNLDNCEYSLLCIKNKFLFCSNRTELNMLYYNCLIFDNPSLCIMYAK